MSDTYFFRIIRYNWFDMKCICMRKLLDDYTRRESQGYCRYHFYCNLTLPSLSVSQALSLSLSLHLQWGLLWKGKNKGDERERGMHIVLRKKRMTLSGYHAYSIRWKKKRGKKGTRGWGRDRSRDRMEDKGRQVIACQWWTAVREITLD